ncbi:MAG: ATPase inhibitor subunit zeta, partial [Pelagibacteraceae bacterium]
MNKFNEREKSFENKYAHDQELQFKVNVKRNKYLAEWVCNRIGKSNVE